VSKKISSGLAIGFLCVLAALSPVSLLTLSQSAHAQPSPTTSSATTSPSEKGNESGGPEKQGNEESAPLHKVDEEHEGGIESIQLILVGAAIVIALGLAYRAGRRRRDK